MNGGLWSDNELAELQPRKNPPPLFPSSQGIPQVRPLVPEVSLFVPSTTAHKDTLSHEQQPSAKHLLPAVQENKPSGGEARVPVLDSGSTDVLNILRLQNDQLMKLQSQVQRLLSIQDENKAQSKERTSLLEEIECLEKISSTSDAKMTQDLHTSHCSHPNISDNFTQTSTPPSPQKKQAETNTSIYLPQNLENDKILRLINDNISTSQGEASICSNANDFFQDSDVRSMVLGESASTYGKMDVSQDGSVSDEQFEKILCQVQRLLSPLPDSEVLNNSSQVDIESKSEESVNHTLLKTVDRVKQMGASFLNPSDFLSQVKERSPIDTFYEPKASSNIDMIPSHASSDASLIINTAAIKYLNDDQLSKLASSPKHPNDEKLNRPFGLPESHLSVSTRRFLRQHQLFDEPSSPKPESKVISNISTLLNQPKLS